MSPSHSLPLSLSISMEAETEGQNTPPEEDAALKGPSSAETDQVQNADGENAERPTAMETETEKVEETEKFAEEFQGQGQEEQENEDENDGEEVGMEMEAEKAEESEKFAEEKQSQGQDEQENQEENDGDDVDEDDDDEKEESERNEDNGSKASHDRRRKKQIVRLGPREFKTSKTMLHFFLDLFRGWPQNCNVNKYEHMMLEDLLMKGHPEAQRKIGSGIAAFQVRINPEYGCPSFYVIRKDGTAEDFSYRKCVDNLLPLPSHLKPQQDKLKVNRRDQGGGKGGHRSKGRGGGFGRGGGGGRAKRWHHNRKV